MLLPVPALLDHRPLPPAELPPLPSWGMCPKEELGGCGWKLKLAEAAVSHRSRSGMDTAFASGEPEPCRFRVGDMDARVGGTYCCCC